MDERSTIGIFPNRWLCILKWWQKYSLQIKPVEASRAWRDVIRQSHDKASPAPSTGGLKTLSYKCFDINLSEGLSKGMDQHLRTPISWVPGDGQHQVESLKLLNIQSSLLPACLSLFLWTPFSNLVHDPLKPSTPSALLSLKDNLLSQEGWFLPLFYCTQL